jgi:outer membrane protein OmpA-like peptidoglycan-associated protein
LETTIPSNEKGEAVQQAERVVGQEMLSRAVVWSEIINIWSVTCASPEAVKRPIEASLKLATKHLEKKDLAALQEQVELIGLEARRLYRDPWELKREEKKKLINNIYKQLESDGFKVIDEEFGPAVRFTTQKKKKEAPNEEWKQELGKLGSILARLQDLNYVVFVSTGAADRPLTAEKGSTKIANAIKRELVTAGVAEQRILSRGLGAAKPLKSLRGGSVNAAILLVPLGTCK